MTADHQAVLTAPGAPYEMCAPDANGVRRWVHGHHTIRSVVEASAAFGDRPFVALDDRWWTFAEHHRAVADLARHLHDDVGIRPGDRIAVAMRNRPEWSVVFFAAVSIGAIAVAVNSWWNTPEIEHALGSTTPRVVVADRDRALVIDACPSARALERRLMCDDVPVQGWDPLSTVFDSNGNGRLPDVAVTPDDDATLFFTSGTTGLAKGVLGTHLNMTSNLLSRQYFRDLDAAERGAVASDPAAAVSLLTVPLFHVTASHSYLLPALSHGSRLVLMHKWDASAALDLIERHGATAMGGVPHMAAQLLDAQRADPHDLHTLKAITVGGAPCPPSLVARFGAELAGVEPGNGYGMTETSSVATYGFGHWLRVRPNSIGRLTPVMDARVVLVDDADRADGVGELWLRGPNVVRGYWRGPGVDPEPLGPSGWLRTGDLVHLDADGAFTLRGRAKELIIRGGENISPIEVEHVLLEHPAIEDAAVVGLPHETLGEEVMAVVLLRPPARADADDPVARAAVAAALEHCRTRLARFKVPVRVVATADPLPRNAQGKLLRARAAADADPLPVLYP